jgi:hypothetical protein
VLGVDVDAHVLHARNESEHSMEHIRSVGDGASH